jgi:cell division protein FtsI (penicillin-binding protein 3)
MTRPFLRLGAVQVSFFLGMLLVLGRAAQVQLIDGAAYATAAEEQRTEREAVRAARGGIFDRNGSPLALTQPVYAVGVAPNELRDVVRDRAVLVERLNIPDRVVRQALEKRWAYFGGPFSSAQVHELRGMRGVYLTESLQRFYPRSGLARTLIGTPGGDGRPASGIERAFDGRRAA